MHDTTRADIDAALDTLQELGWEVSSFDADEDTIGMQVADSGLETHPIAVELSIEATKHYRGDRDADESDKGDDNDNDNDNDNDDGGGDGPTDGRKIIEPTPCPHCDNPSVSIRTSVGERSEFVCDECGWRALLSDDSDLI